MHRVKDEGKILDRRERVGGSRGKGGRYRNEER